MPDYVVFGETDAGRYAPAIAAMARSVTRTTVGVARCCVRSMIAISALGNGQQSYCQSKNAWIDTTSLPALEI
jgi:hypothetical protein